MAASNAEGLNVACVEESSQGATPPPTSGWLNLEPDAVGDPGADYKKMARTPFTITRQKRRPFIAGMDVALTLDLDVTKDHIDAFGEAVYKSNWKHSGGTGQSKFLVTAATDGGGSEDGFTVADDGDLPAGTLVVARGFTNPENNGVFVVASGSTTTSIKVATGTLVAEASPPANATIDVCGFQFGAGDLELDSDGNLITTTKALTALGLNEHQFVYLPGPDDVDPPYRFDNDDYYGFAEVIDIATNMLTLRRRGWTVGASDDGGTRTVRLFFTKWIRNVARSDADENLVSHAFEITYSDLGTGPADAYEYPLGCMVNTATFQMPVEGKMTMQLAFIGMTSEDPSTTRHTGPSSALNVVTALAISTSTDVTRLSVDNVDETGLMSDFRDITLTINNNISPEKTVGHLGNRYTPLGVFEAKIESEALFVTPEIVAAVRDNRIVRLAAGGRNDDFGLLFDIPSAGSLSSKKKIEHNKLIGITSEIDGFMDSDSRFTCGLSVFAYLPTQAPGLET